MSWAFQKSGQPITQTTMPTPNAQAQPLWQQLLASALTGAKALGGDSGSLQQMMGGSNDILKPFFDLLRKQAVSGSNAQATMTGGGGAAFDSTRGAAMAGSELAGVDQLQTQTLYQNLQDTLSRALQMDTGVMGMGMGRTQATPTEWSPLGSLAGLAMTPFGGGTGIFGTHSAPAGG